MILPLYFYIMVTTRFYYDQLKEKDKKIYKAIYDGIMQYKSYVEVPGISLSENNVGWIYHCVLWDNPYIFSVGEYAMWHALSPDGKRIKMTTLCDKASESVYRKQIEEIVNKVLSVSGLMQMSDFQKEVFVHDFIINNVEYDETHGNDGERLEPYTVYGALVQHKAVCEGIAKTTKLLLNMLDVKCIVVSGEYEGHGHAWNIVKIENWAYNLDVTMDMGRVIHKGKMRYNYFNFRNEDISAYKVDSPDMIPECKAIKNNYVVRTAGYVSSVDRLKKYIATGLRKKKRCLYFKANKRVEGHFSNISFKTFQSVVDQAYREVSDSMGISTKRFIDPTGDNEILTYEITYL